MKKISIIIFGLFIIITLPCFADSLDSNSQSGDLGDLMQYSKLFENPHAGQKQVTDEEFDKVYEQVKAKRHKGKKPPQFKGKDVNQENSGSCIKETADKNLILSLPVALTNGDGVEIPIGHYKVVGEKKDDKTFLNFYQSGVLIAKVPAIETQSDFDKPELNFVQLIPYNESRVKIIYGSMDFNAYTFIKIENDLSKNN